VLPPDELELLLASKNPPLLVLSAIGQIMAVSDMRIESKTHMDESVRVLQESLGSCEKILTTPIPISYTRHTGRFLVLWLTCLPFVIWQVGGWVHGTDQNTRVELHTV
jgi:predicted membrane chloride channel (bestrophin family)